MPYTKATWDSATDALAMLREEGYRVDARRLVLAACTLVRVALPRSPDPVGAAYVLATTEAWVRGDASDVERGAACAAFACLRDEPGASGPWVGGADARRAVTVLSRDAFAAVRYAAISAATSPPTRRGATFSPAALTEASRRMAPLLREVVPWRVVCGATR